MATTDFAKKYYERMYSTDGTEIVKSSKDLLKEKEQLTENDIEFLKDLVTSHLMRLLI